MKDEAEALVRTLAHTALVVAQLDDPARIRLGYEQAGEMLARTAERTFRERVTACLQRFERLKARGDAACVGWMLAALQVRLDAGDLPGSTELRLIVDAALRDLRARTGGTLH